MLTPEPAGEVKGFLWDLKEADLSSGGGDLAATLEAEERLADVDSLVGLGFDQVSQVLDQRLQAAATRSATGESG